MMRNWDNRTKVVIMTGIIVFLLIIGSLGALYLMRSKKTETPETPPVVQAPPKESKPIEPPKEEEETPPSSNNQGVAGNQSSSQQSQSGKPIKTPVAGPE